MNENMFLLIGFIVFCIVNFTVLYFTIKRKFDCVEDLQIMLMTFTSIIMAYVDVMIIDFIIYKLF